MRRGWGAGEQTDRKWEACRPPERKLTSGSSSVGFNWCLLPNQPSLVLQLQPLSAPGVAAQHGTDVQLWGKSPAGQMDTAALCGPMDIPE